MAWLQERPPWASLPAELWQQVTLRVADSSYSGEHQEVLQQDAWFRVAARLSCACKLLREALLGRSATRLWTNVTLSAPRVHVWHPAPRAELARARCATQAEHGAPGVTPVTCTPVTVRAKHHCGCSWLATTSAS